MSNDAIQCEGRVEKINRGGIFDVEITVGDPPNEQTRMIVARCSGKMKKFQIKLVRGDYVRVELSPYDLTKGRISRRHKEKPSKEYQP